MKTGGPPSPRSHGSRAEQNRRTSAGVERRLSLCLSLLLQGMRGVRDPSATRAPPLFDGALEECEKLVCFILEKNVVFSILHMVAPGITNL